MEKPLRLHDNNNSIRSWLNSPLRRRRASTLWRKSFSAAASSRYASGIHSPEAVQPPREHNAWTWGWNFAPSPKVWTTDTIPGRKSFSPTAASMSSLTVS